MGNVVVLEVKNALRVLDDRGSVGSDEELDRLGHAVVAQEGPRLTPDEFALRGSGRDIEETGTSAVRVGSVGDGFVSSSRKLDIDKVNLELPLSLDSDEDRRSTASDDDLIGVVDRLEDESESSLLHTDGQRSKQYRPGEEVECTHKLHDDTLDERSERDLLALLRVVEVLGEDGGNFSVGVSLELVSSLLEDESELLVCRQKKKTRELGSSSDRTNN